MKYQVLYYEYQLKSKSDEMWNERKILDKLEMELGIDPACSETFDTLEEARASMMNDLDKMFRPTIEKANVGYVLRGGVFELVEENDDGEITYSELFTKGMQMKYKIYLVECVNGLGLELDESGRVKAKDRVDIEMQSMYYVEIWKDEFHLDMCESFKEFSQAKEWAEEQIEIFG